ncbi:MAG: hypothetical protein FK730_15005 [Asgard group archaeon]|nr:hypothetical protein [Asgard group archaeon]
MVECPYNPDDFINLKQQYKISSLLSETQTYWVFEAIQITTQKEVMIKIYINERFSSIEEVEDAWKKEINDLQTEAEYQGVPVEFIESDMKFESGEKRFFIVFSQIIDLETPESKADDVLETIEEPSSPTPSRLDIETVKDSQKIESPPPPPAIVSSEIVDLPEIDDDEARDVELAEEAEEGIRSEEITDLGKISAPAGPKPTGKPPASPPPKQKRKKEAAYAKPIEEAKEKEKAILALEEEEEEKDYLKHITMDYFDRMNPQNYYPLKISISDILEDISAPIVNPLTGERKVQKQTEIDVTLKDPIVTIKPIIPGCSVVPSEIDTDFSLAKDEVTFFITPGVKGEIMGHIKFINEGKIVYIYDFEAKVVDPNVAKLITAYGILASFIPKILTILNVDFGLSELWTTDTVLGTISLTGLIALAGILPAIIVGVGVRQRLKPKSCKTHFKLKDFRLIDFKIKSTKKPSST